MSKKTTKSIISALSKAVSNLQLVQQPVRRPTGNRRKPGFRRSVKASSANRSSTRALPAAYATHVRPRFAVVSHTINSVRVSGCDLVYPISDTVTQSDASVFAIIPANPAYWSGTKIGQFAPAYMNYRPISMTFSYIPQVAVTQPGTVFMGTLWNGAPSTDDIQQSLFTSNGGCLTQCYIPCDTSITLGSNLPQNLFTLAGSLNPDTNPFIFVAGVRPATVVPGYFYVSYTYEFKNPIGTAWKFFRSPPQKVGEGPRSSDDNTSLVVLSKPIISPDFGSSSISPIPVGTILDLESDGVYYHGTKLSLHPDTLVLQFSSTNVFSSETPLAAAADTLLLSFNNTKETPVALPLAALESVHDAQVLNPVDHDGVTYDQALILSRTDEGVSMQVQNIAPENLVQVRPGDKVAYMRTGDQSVWARVWNATKKALPAIVSAVGAAALAACEVGPFSTYLNENLFPNKYFSQEQKEPCYIDLVNPDPAALSRGRAILGSSSTSVSSSSSARDYVRVPVVHTARPSRV